MGSGRGGSGQEVGPPPRPWWPERPAAGTRWREPSDPGSIAAAARSD